MICIAVNDSFASYKVMIQAKAVDINYRTEFYGDMLGVAAGANHLDWARFCLENGANFEFNRVDFYKTVIAAAAELGFEDMVELLLQYGAKLEGSGAIVLAAAAGKVEMVRWLLAKGVDVNEYGIAFRSRRMKMHQGTPLHRATINGKVETAKALIEAGADLTRQDYFGRTPEMLAEQCHQTEILHEIRAHSSVDQSGLIGPAIDDAGGTILGLSGRTPSTTQISVF